MAKNFISNSETSTRMFKYGWMEALSKVHFSVPLIIYIPVIGFLCFKAISNGIAALAFSGYFIAGFLVWTITEYLLHRYIFHYVPTSKIGLRLHFIFHGVHHDYPKDKLRLVMPPSASIPLALLFYFLFSLVLHGAALYSFFAAFLLGYLTYDMMHYAMHHYTFKSGLMKRIKKHHMLHHYQDASKGYGVSSALWDKVFHSGFSVKEISEQPGTQNEHA